MRLEAEKSPSPRGCGDEVVILLGGGTKKRQQGDIEAAQNHWRDYKDRKKDEA